MKVIPVAEARAGLSEYIKISEQEVVLITRNGRPVAMLTAIKDDEDLERLVLSRSPRLRAILEQSRQAVAAGEAYSSEDFWSAVERDAEIKD